MVQRAWAFTVVGFLWSVLRAVSLGCLLFALLSALQGTEVGSRRFATANPSGGGSDGGGL